MAAPLYPYGDIGADIPDLDNSNKVPPRPIVNILFYFVLQVNI
jgi:hypothetical protein